MRAERRLGPIDEISVNPFLFPRGAVERKEFVKRRNRKFLEM